MNVPKFSIEALKQTLNTIGVTVLDRFLPAYQNLPSELTTSIPQIQANRIRVKNEAKRRIKVAPRIKVRGDSPNEEATEEEVAIRAVINVESNELIKELFISLVRRWLGTPYVDASGNPNKQWLYPHDLMNFANEFNLPFAALEHNDHWYLMLGTPTVSVKHGYFGVLVYDPMTGGEEFLNLNSWSSEAKAREGWKQYLGTIIACSEAAKSLIARNEYNLSIMDESTALANVKLAPKQNGLVDSWNCGIICLFQAILIAALIASDDYEFAFFREEALAQFEAEFGLDILTREQILGE